MGLKFEIITEHALKAVFQRDKWHLCAGDSVMPVLLRRGGGWCWCLVHHCRKWALTFTCVIPSTAVEAVFLIVPAVLLRYSSLPDLVSPSSAILNHLYILCYLPLLTVLCAKWQGHQKRQNYEKLVCLLVSSTCLFYPLFHCQNMSSEELHLHKLLLSNFPLKIKFWHLTSFWCCLRSLPSLKVPASHIQVEVPGICCWQVRVNPW